MKTNSFEHPGLILIIIFFVCLAGTATAQPTSGDTNGNGTIDIVDALLVAQVYVGLVAEPFFPDAADVDCDSTVTITDALLIAQYYVELIQSFPCPEPITGPTPDYLINQLSLDAFKSNIATLAGFGTRYWNTKGNQDALDWIENELGSYGYQVERHYYIYQGTEKYNLYATKIGTKHPEEMYILSAHMDSYNTQSSTFAPGANDDASGSSLVMEAARVFAPANIHTEYSIRFILWNNEETGLNGSKAYASDRAPLRGEENPAGSGIYPEPDWKGIIACDMILYDHGNPPQPEQIPNADINIDYRESTTFASASLDLAKQLESGNSFSGRYPVSIGSRMYATDSYSFRNNAPSVSVRENTRDDIGSGWTGSSPHHHQSSDTYDAYSEKDFLLGFTALETVVASLTFLSGVN